MDNYNKKIMFLKNEKRRRTSLNITQDLIINLKNKNKILEVENAKLLKRLGDKK